MKVYIVTSGEYSGYSIEAVFTDEVKAWQFASLGSDMRIEEYEVDQYRTTGEQKSYIIVTYDFKDDRIVDAIVSTTPADDEIGPGYHALEFSFQIDNTLRMFKIATENPTISKVLLKVAQERFAKYLYIICKSKKELIEQGQKEIEEYKLHMKNRYGNLVFYTTASPSVDFLN